MPEIQTDEIVAEELFFLYTYDLAQALEVSEKDLTPHGPLGQALAKLSEVDRKKLKESTMVWILSPWQKKVGGSLSSAKERTIINLFHQYRQERGF